MRRSQRGVGRFARGLGRTGFVVGSTLAAACGWWGRPAFAEPAAGRDLQRLLYNHPGLVVDLGVGLWAAPLPMDYDQDGDLDLVVACTDKPYNGIYFFENPGGGKLPVFQPARRLADGLPNLQVSYVNGRPRVLRPGIEYVDFLKRGLADAVKLPVPAGAVPTAERVRANHWRYVDYDGDDDHDLIVGVEDWGEYGWDDAFDRSGRWTRGPLHGRVYLLANAGTDERPSYRTAVAVEADGRPIDTFGMPSPCFADFDADGDLDLVCGEFRDRLTYFQNVGTRSGPAYAAGRPVQSTAGEVRMDLCMIVPVAVDWDADGDADLIVGQEDGRVAFIENTGRNRDGQPLFEPPRFFQQQADAVKFGALATPAAFDWDGDGDSDLLCGNTAGYVGFIENLGGAPPRWAAPRYLSAGGRTIRIQAGENGSIQGPAEAKWGYTTLAVADWDHDGLPDVVANSIWGRVIWFRNQGRRTEPRLAAAAPVEVDWPGGAAPKPPWTWWDPAPGELAAQWRTTPVVIDLDRDGLNDLVMLDAEGFLAFFRRERIEGRLRLHPGRRAFRLEPGAPTVYDAGHQPVDLNVPGDDRSTLVGPDAHGRIGFLRSTPGAAKPAVKTVRSSVGASPADGASPRLRLNAGWAGRSGRRKLCLADLDGDDRPDLLVNSVNVNLLLNVTPPGSKDEWVFRDSGAVADTVLAGHDTAPTVLDLDGDGELDLLIGAEDGHFYHRKKPGEPGREP
ncbi:MAG: VCBS repeat-containing protein [Phycisphaerae bacterium]